MHSKEDILLKKWCKRLVSNNFFKTTQNQTTSQFSFFQSKFRDCLLSVVELESNLPWFLPWFTSVNLPALPTNPGADAYI